MSIDFTTYKMGIASIDDQHSKWIEMIKELQTAQEEKGSNADIVVLQILVRLYAYASSHFAYEEKLFSSYSYPLKDEHILQHKQFLKMLDNFKQDVEKKNVPMIILVLNTMQRWFIDHIKVEDSKYVEFMKSRGVT